MESTALDYICSLEDRILDSISSSKDTWSLFSIFGATDGIHNSVLPATDGIQCSGFHQPSSACKHEKCLFWGNFFKLDNSTSNACLT